VQHAITAWRSDQMGKDAGNSGGNWFSRIWQDIREYAQRCFGVNDTEKRYDRDIEQRKVHKAKVDDAMKRQNTNTTGTKKKRSTM
jgi:hypothetical protein